MADSDRSRSPLPPRDRQEQPGQRQAFSCFPRWYGPMGFAVRSLSTMPRPQNVPKWLPCQPGPYGMGRMMTPSPPSLLCSIDPDSQHENTHLRSQLAELGQRLGDDPPPHTGQQSSSSQTTPIQRALMGSGAPAPPPAFDPACLLTIPRLSNNWLTDNLPSGLAGRTFPKWLKESPTPGAMSSSPILPATWWPNQPAYAVETAQKVAVMTGIPVCQLQKNVNATNLIKVLTVEIAMTY